MSTRTDVRPTAPDNSRPRRSRRPRGRRLVVVAVAAALLVGGFGVWWFVLRDTAPAAVSLDSAVAGVSGAPTANTATATGATADGTWTVDTTITNAEGAGTFAGFRVEEQLVGVGATTAVGRSGDVTGTVTVEGDTVTAAAFTVGLTDVTSNDSRRVRAINSALATSRFPSATFVLTEPIDLGSPADGAGPAEGERISTTAVGDLTVHGVTRSTTVAIDAQVEDGVLVLVGSAPVTFSDFGITAPSAPIVASVDDHGVVELQLYLTR
jgi:polyisoprenoid-binding protein YceI